MALPGPTHDQVRAVDPVLTSVVNMRDNADTDFIADRAFPPDYEEGRSSGTIFTMNGGFRSAGNREIDRGVGSPYARVGFTPSSTSFNCREYGASAALDRGLRAKSQIPMDLPQLYALVCLREVQIQRELRCVTAFFGTGDWTNEQTLGAAAQWDDAGGTALADLWTAKRTVKLNHGSDPTVGVIGYDGFRVAVQNGDITGLMPSATQQSQITFSQLAERLAEAFELRELYVGRAVRNTSDEGQAEAYGFVWTDNLLVFARGEGQMASSAMQFASTDGGSATVTDRYFVEDTREDVVRVREERDELVVDALGGYLTINLAN